MSIGAVVPFLISLTQPEKVLEIAFVRSAADYFGVSTSSQILVTFAFTFGFLALLAGLIRIYLLWFSTQLAFEIGADISYEMFRKTLFQPYKFHIENNSSILISAISNKSNSVIYSCIMPALNLIAAIIIIAMILIALVYIDPKLAIGTLLIFGILYLIIFKVVSKSLHKKSKETAEGSTKTIKILQEGLGGIRDILLDRSQYIFCSKFKDADLALRKAQGGITFFTGFPRYAIEALGLIFFAVAASLLAKQTNGISNALPILGVMALSAQRLLPLLQQAYGSISSIKGSQGYLKDVIALLNQTLIEEPYADLSKLNQFRSGIELRNIRFCYGTRVILDDVSLYIKKGSKLGIIGSTGSGKSTLIDIVMGLISKDEGSLLVDDEIIDFKNAYIWQKQISHVPQSIYLADTTIEENIAFGIKPDLIDFSLVIRAAKMAHIYEYIQSLSCGFKTNVGERGVKLSGGQRQRLGLARAFYKQASVMILDEATSALDVEMESNIMKSIDSMGNKITMLVIAHRLSTLQNCDQIIRLEKGKIVWSGTYQAMELDMKK